LAAPGADPESVQFTLDELDELLDYLQGAIYPAKGNERQKVLRIVEKVSKVLGSNIEPDEISTGGHRKQNDAVFQIKIILRGVYPPIWRRIQTKDCTLEEVHAIIQVAMGWEFDHAWSFDIGGVEHTDREVGWDEDEVEAADTLLSEVVPPGHRRPRFSYTYDFGDDWVHELIVEERFAPQEGVTYPICVAGQRAGPPEDCGGPWGYMDLVEASKSPDHARYDEFWSGSATTSIRRSSIWKR
jgi:hypothetical protein